jgi:hypothetical protein
MGKKTVVTVIGGIVLGASLITGVAHAYSGIRLMIDGQEMVADVKPQMINNRVFVPLRFVSDALGVKVNWNSSSQTVSIDSQGKGSLKSEADQFIRGLAPKSPDQALQTYVNGLQNRNAALQYAALSEELKKQVLPQFEKFNWVTGGSSPWISNWNTTSHTNVDEHTIRYEVQLNRATSAGPEPAVNLTITVSQQQDHWFVSDIFSDRDLGRSGFPMLETGLPIQFFFDNLKSDFSFAKSQVDAASSFHADEFTSLVDSVKLDDMKKMGIKGEQVEYMVTFEAKLASNTPANLINGKNVRFILVHVIDGEPKIVSMATSPTILPQAIKK